MATQDPAGSPEHPSENSASEKKTTMTAKEGGKTTSLGGQQGALQKLTVPLPLHMGSVGVTLFSSAPLPPSQVRETSSLCHYRYTWAQLVLHSSVLQLYHQARLGRPVTVTVALGKPHPPCGLCLVLVHFISNVHLPTCPNEPCKLQNCKWGSSES